MTWAHSMSQTNVLSQALSSVNTLDFARPVEMRPWATGTSPEAMPQMGVAAPDCWAQPCLGWVAKVSESPVVCRLVFLAPLRWGWLRSVQPKTFGPPYLRVFFAVPLFHQCFQTCVRAHFHWRPSGSLEPVGSASRRLHTASEICHGLLSGGAAEGSAC